jgi:hypothetical protein
LEAEVFDQRVGQQCAHGQQGGTQNFVYGTFSVRDDDVHGLQIQVRQTLNRPKRRLSILNLLLKEAVLARLPPTRVILNELRAR